MKAQQKLRNKVRKDFHICVGLDTDINKIPKHLLNLDNPVLEFNKVIVENTIDYAAAYKLNFAFYEKDGAKGFENIIETIKLIPDDTLIIADAKRGDIGNTAKMYAESVFNYFRCDAVTVNPYMGIDSVRPFLEFKDKITFVLGLTSNPSAEDFELKKLNSGEYLYREVIRKINEWNTENNCGVVFGATKYKSLTENINLLKGLFTLLPGVGTQGGKLEDIVKLFGENNYEDYLINVSRALIYADDSKKFGTATRKKLIEYNEIVSNILN